MVDPPVAGVASRARPDAVSDSGRILCVASLPSPSSGQRSGSGCGSEASSTDAQALALRRRVARTLAYSDRGL